MKLDTDGRASVTIVNTSGYTHHIVQSATIGTAIVRQEVAKQIQKMQEAGVIQPSKCPWESPVVMVRKKDGSHIDFVSGGEGGGGFK